MNGSAMNGRPLGSRSRPAALKARLNSADTTFLLEAHDAISAKIAAGAGFPALWASGLTISASMGLRDANEATWTQMLDAVEFMCDSVDTPILMDGDSGYGNFNTVRRLVRKSEQRGVAGLCIEDKLFPKLNSFAGSNQALVPVEDFKGKLAAATDARRDGDYCIVARTEAFIAGAGLAEALDRAHAYREAGADAIVVHSKRPDASELIAFGEGWHESCPLIAIPTTYYRTPMADLNRAGFSTIVWANHLLRGAVASMRMIADSIFRQSSVIDVEPDLVTVADLFEITDMPELLAAEQRYGGWPD